MTADLPSGALPLASTRSAPRPCATSGVGSCGVLGTLPTVLQLVMGLKVKLPSRVTSMSLTFDGISSFDGFSNSFDGILNPVFILVVSDAGC